MNHKNILVSIGVGLAVALSFVAGTRYSEAECHIESIIGFANISGDHIVVTNRLFSDVDDRAIEERLHVFNQRAINGIGCALWLDVLSAAQDQNLDMFSQGIAIARSNLGAREELVESCLQNLNSFVD